MITVSEVRESLRKANVSHNYEMSFKNGSMYWSIGESYYRVSDHAKPYESKYVRGVNDFSSYEEMLLTLVGTNSAEKFGELIKAKIQSDKAAEIASRVVGEWYFDEDDDCFYQHK